MSRTPVAWPRPTRPRLSPRAVYRLAPLLRPNPLYRRVAAWLERHPRALRWFTAAEERSKEALFGCRMCGQCALPATGYACPMTCPKQLRNGPCGGVAMNGDCEVYPGVTCVWVTAWERAEEAGHGDDLRTLQRPVDHRLTGSSSWVGYWQGRDEDLWTPDGGLRLTPTIFRGADDRGRAPRGDTPRFRAPNRALRAADSAQSAGQRAKTVAEESRPGAGGAAS